LYGPLSNGEKARGADLDEASADREGDRGYVGYDGKGRVESLLLIVGLAGFADCGVASGDEFDAGDSA